MRSAWVQKMVETAWRRGKAQPACDLSLLTVSNISDEHVDILSAAFFVDVEGAHWTAALPGGRTLTSVLSGTPSHSAPHRGRPAADKGDAGSASGRRSANGRENSNGRENANGRQGGFDHGRESAPEGGLEAKQGGGHEKAHGGGHGSAPAAAAADPGLVMAMPPAKAAQEASAALGPASPGSAWRSNSVAQDLGDDSGAGAASDGNGRQLLRHMANEPSLPGLFDDEPTAHSGSSLRAEAEAEAEVQAQARKRKDGLLRVALTGPDADENVAALLEMAERTERVARKSRGAGQNHRLQIGILSALTGAVERALADADGIATEDGSSHAGHAAQAIGLRRVDVQGDGSMRTPVAQLAGGSGGAAAGSDGGSAGTRVASAELCRVRSPPGGKTMAPVLPPPANGGCDSDSQPGSGKEGMRSDSSPEPWPADIATLAGNDGAAQPGGSSLRNDGRRSNVDPAPQRASLAAHEHSVGSVRGSKQAVGAVRERLASIVGGPIMQSMWRRFLRKSLQVRAPEVPPLRRTQPAPPCKRHANQCRRQRARPARDCLDPISRAGSVQGPSNTPPVAHACCIGLCSPLQAQMIYRRERCRWGGLPAPAAMPPAAVVQGLGWTSGSKPQRWCRADTACMECAGTAEAALVSILLH